MAIFRRVSCVASHWPLLMVIVGVLFLKFLPCRKSNVNIVVAHRNIELQLEYYAMLLLRRNRIERSSIFIHSLDLFKTILLSYGESPIVQGKYGAFWSKRYLGYIRHFFVFQVEYMILIINP